MSSKKWLLGLVAACAVSGASAQLLADVGIAMPNEFVAYKPKKGNAQMSLQAWCTYYNPNILDPKAIRKAKASGIATFYVSNNTNVSPDDRLVATKKVKMKTFLVKPTKLKVNLTPEDKGKYLLAVIESPEDQYFSNNVDHQYIPLNAF